VWDCKVFVWSGDREQPVGRGTYEYQIVTPAKEVSAEPTINGESNAEHELPPVVILFDDATGQHWVRNAHGKLMKLSQDAWIGLGLRVWFSTNPPWSHELKCLTQVKKSGAHNLDNASARVVQERLSPPVD
jgi:hypothetical protein